MELNFTRVRSGKEYIPAYEVAPNVFRPVPALARKSVALFQAMETDIAMGAAVAPKKQMERVTVIYADHICPSTQVWGGNGRTKDFALSRTHADNVDQEDRELHRRYDPRRYKSWKRHRRTQYRQRIIYRQQDECFVKHLSY